MRGPRELWASATGEGPAGSIHGAWGWQELAFLLALAALSMSYLAVWCLQGPERHLSSAVPCEVMKVIDLEPLGSM